MSTKTKKTKRKSTARKGGTKKPSMQVVSKQDRLVESEVNGLPKIEISKDSKVKPDYSKVIGAVSDIINWAKEQKMPVTEWQEKEFKRTLEGMAAANDPLCVYIVSQLEAGVQANKAEEVYISIDTFVRPQNSFLHSESPAPKAFMQRNVLFIDKINANLEEHTKDPNFWWQPVTNPSAYAVVEAVTKLDHACRLGTGVDFGGITNNVKATT